MGYIGQPATGVFNLGDNTVTTQKILDGTITGDDIASGTIQQANLATGVANDVAKNASQDSNIALLGFLRSTDHATSVLNMQNGFIDQFEDQTGVDDTNSVGATYNAAGDYYGSVNPNVKTIFRFDGADASTTMTDEISGEAYSAVGNAQLDTGVTKFGTATLLLDGTGDAVLKDAASADHTFGTGDFTAECWIYPTTISGNHMVIGNSSSTTGTTVWRWYLNASGNIVYGNTSAILLTSSGTTITINNWWHVSVNRISGTTKIYINGAEKGSASDAGDLSVNEAFQIGNMVDGNDFFGNIDDVVIVKGEGIRTGAFTSPSSAFTPAGNMALIAEPQVALTAPDSAHVSLFNEEVDTLTINTDILAWVSRSKQTFTATNATNVLNATTHGLVDTDRVMVISSAADLPNGLTSDIVYYVVTAATSTLQVSLTSGGAAVTSSDDGTGTHSILAVTQATLTDQGDFDTGKATLSGTVDISGQPSDTDMTLIVQTKNGKDTKLHGQALQYS